MNTPDIHHNDAILYNQLNNIDLQNSPNPIANETRRKTNETATRVLSENPKVSEPAKPGFIATTFSKIKESIKQTINKITSSIASIFSFSKPTAKTFTEQEIDKSAIQESYKDGFKDIKNETSQSVFKKDRLRLNDSHFKVVYNETTAFELLSNSKNEKKREKQYKADNEKIDKFFKGKDMEACKIFVKNLMNQNLTTANNQLGNTKHLTLMDYASKRVPPQVHDKQNYTITIKDTENTISLLIEGTTTLKYTSTLPDNPIQHFRSKFIIEIQKENIEENGFITDFDLYQIDTLELPIQNITEQSIDEDFVKSTYQNKENSFEKDRTRKNDHHFTIIENGKPVIELFPTSSKNEEQRKIEYEADNENIDAYFKGTDLEACKDLIKGLMSQTIANCNETLKNRMNDEKLDATMKAKGNYENNKLDYTFTLSKDQKNISILVDGNAWFIPEHNNPQDDTLSAFNFKTKFMITIPTQDIVNGRIIDFKVHQIDS